MPTSTRQVNGGAIQDADRKDAMLTWLVGQMHVSATNRQVIRHVISRLKNGYQKWRTIPVARRKQMMRSIIRTHQDNREIYNYVMKGGMNKK